MLGGGFLNSRLATRIRQEEGLSYGVGASFGAQSLDEIGTFQGYAISSPENADKVVAAFREEVAKALDEGFTAEEVDAAKSGYLDALQRGRSNDATVANILSSNLFLDRDMDFIKRREAAIAALTADDINAALKRHLDPGEDVVLPRRRLREYSEPIVICCRSGFYIGCRNDTFRIGLEAFPVLRHTRLD